MRHTAVLFLLYMILFSGCGRVINDARITEYRGGRKAAVSLTYDDGIIGHYTKVFPHLDSLGLVGTFWVNGCFVGPDDDYAPRMRMEMWKEMSGKGHEISNHSWSHVDLTSLSEEQLREEVVRNDDVIEQVTGIRPITFCFPFNSWNELVLQVCSEGRAGTRLFQEAHGQTESHSTLESMLSWLDRVTENGEWGVSMAHGIDHGWDKWEDENELWEFYSELAARKNEVWVDTFAAVSSYINERDNCRIVVREYRNFITISPICSLDPSIYREKLTAEVIIGGEKRYFDFNPLGGKQKFDK